MTGDDGEVDLSVEGLDILDNTRIHPECYHTYDMYANNPICRMSFVWVMVCENGADQYTFTCL